MRKEMKKFIHTLIAAALVAASSMALAADKEIAVIVKTAN